MTDNDNKTIIEVSLRIWGGSLHPEHVTNALNVEPTRSHLKGDEKISPKGKKRIMKSGHWELNTKEIVDSNLLVDRLGYLIQILKSSNQDLKLLSGYQGAEISFIIGATDDGSIEFILNSEVLKQIVQLGVELHFVVI